MGMLDIDPPENGTSSEGQSDISNLRRRSQQLQAQIAEALGLPVAAFHQPKTSRPDVQGMLDTTQADAVAMNHDCFAMIEAYTRIADPRERRRLLEIVRDAAEIAAKT